MNSKTADVVFIFPPAHGNLGAFKGHLGLAYLRAALAGQPFSTTQYLNSRPGTVGEVSDDILRFHPRIAGFTVYDANFPLALALATNIKRKQPDVKIVFGGPSASFCAEPILERQPVVDACVMGEAEETGAAIFGALLNGGPSASLPPGLVFRREDGLVSTGYPPLVGCMGPVPSALDTAPSPYLSGTLEDGRAGVLTGRGCTHHCQYCCFAALGRKTLRLHSIDRVLAELEYIAAHQKRTGESYVVPIHDDAFTLLPSRAKTLCQAIADRNLGLVLSCITRADTVDDELIRMMRDAGFVSLAFGLESAVPSVLRAMGKVRPPDFPDPDLTLEQDFVERVKTSVTTAKKYGLNVGVSIILGLPSEKPEDGAATIRFVRRLPIDYYMHNFLWVFPGTPLWETHDRYGIGCTINSMGLATTTEYAYDLTKIRPAPNCSLEQDARLVMSLGTDGLYGCGASTAPDGGISVAVVHDGELKKATAEWLSGMLDVGGILVQIYPSLKRRQEDLRLYLDRRAYTECLMPARHHIQVVPRPSKNGGKRWMVECSGADLFCSHKPDLVTIRESNDASPFTAWLQGKPSEYALCEVSEYLNAPDEILQFLDETGDSDLGARLRHMPMAPGLKYPGRWLEGTAPCLGLTRIEVDEDGCVRPCRHGDPIGVVGDTREALANRLAQLARDAEQRRGCDACENRHCSRCPFPGVDDSTYCRIMREQVPALNFLKWTYLYSRVLFVLSLQRDKLGGD